MTPPAHHQDPAAVHLDEAALRDVLLVRAFEESDPHGELLGRGDRERATADARSMLPEERDPSGAELAAFLERRARTLAGRLEERLPLVRRLRAPHAGPSTGLLFAALVVLGLATNFLGASKEIHVLANPLATLIAWNLAVYTLLVLLAFARPSAPGLLARLGSLRLSGLRRAHGGGAGGGRPAGVARAATARFGLELARTAAPLYAARGRRLLHLGAMALVLGALGGLYLRGLVLEYRAVWESTFLTPEFTERALSILFAPASALTGIGVPALEPEGGAAAPWIHLYAVTVLLLVLLPRTLLAWHESRRVRRLASGGLLLDVDAPAFRRLASAHRGQGLVVQLLPYSHEQSPETRDGLRALLHDVFGARSHVEVLPGVPYGSELGELVAALSGPGGAREQRIVLCFALAQTPESEVHGRLLDELARARPGEPTLVIVDGTGYAERLGGGPAAAKRAEEHRNHWDRVLREAGQAPLHVDLDADDPARLAREAAERLRTEESTWSR